jgi:hypothetical protein
MQTLKLWKRDFEEPHFSRHLSTLLLASSTLSLKYTCKAVLLSYEEEARAGEEEEN